MFASDFSSGTIAPFAIKGNDSVAIDTVHTYNGQPTLRFNLYAHDTSAGESPFIDPFTNKESNNNPLDFSVAYKTSNASRSWDSTSYRYWVRFDDADNRDELNEPTNMKVGYFSDTFNESTGTSITTTQSAIYPTMSTRNGCGVWSYYRNGREAGRFDPTPQWPSGAIQTGGTNRGMQFDGNWNKIEIVFDRVKNTITMWVNAIKVIANTTQTEEIQGWNGEMPVDPNFRDDHFSMFHADYRQWKNSANRTGIKGGGNLYGFQFFKGNIKAWEAANGPI